MELCFVHLSQYLCVSRMKDGHGALGLYSEVDDRADAAARSSACQYYTLLVTVIETCLHIWWPF